MKRNFKTLISILKIYKNVLNEYEELTNSTNKHFDNSVYAIKINECKNIINFVNKEMKYIENKLGKQAYIVIEDRYINNKLIEDVAKKNGLSRSDIYKKLNDWIKEYEK